MEKPEMTPEELYALKLKELEEQKGRKMWMADRWKEYSLTNINHVYEAQKKQADEEFEFERQSLEAKLLSDNTDRKSTEKKSKKEVAGLGVGGLPDGAGGAGGRIMTRNSRRRLRGDSAAAGGGAGGPMSTDHLPGTKEPSTGVVGVQGGRGGVGGAGAGKMRKLNPPHINYTLTDDEIVQDLSLFYQRGVLTPEERKRLFAEAIDFSPSLPSTNFTDREVNAM